MLMIKSSVDFNEDTLVVRRNAFEAQEAVFGRYDITRAKILVIERARQHFSGSLLWRLLLLVDEPALTTNPLHSLTSSVNLRVPLISCGLVDILLSKGRSSPPQRGAHGNCYEDARAPFHCALHLAIVSNVNKLGNAASAEQYILIDRNASGSQYEANIEAN